MRKQRPRLRVWGALFLAHCGTPMMLPMDGANTAPDEMSVADSAPTPMDVSTSDAATNDGMSAPETMNADVVREAATINGQLATRTEMRNTGSTGEIDVTVHIENHRSFMMVANSDSNARVAFVSIRDPRGNTIFRWQDWANGPRSLTKAIFADRTGATLNWPVRAEDPALIAGDYVVRVGSYRVDGITSRPDVALSITTITNPDRDLERGRVRVAVLWANGLSNNRALVTATEAAVAHWREVWMGAGMELDLRYLQTTLPTVLPFPSAAAGDLFLMASSQVMDGEIPVVIGESLNNNLGEYGAAGSLPGPIVHSPQRAIVVGWLANAGGDGMFSANDIQLYGEVLAHEVGHYIGLFHPVERSYDHWDALSDTVECRNERNCNDQLGTNLMFPYSICNMMTGCLSTTVITGQQRGVMQRYTGAL